MVIGIMEKRMETTIMGYIGLIQGFGLRDYGLGLLPRIRDTILINSNSYYPP